MKRGRVYVGIGGWTFEPWRGTFYPEGLPQKKELEFASRTLTSIEINGTFYSSFKPASWIKWRDETPDGFVFAVKGSRYCTNRKNLGEAGESVARFVAQGLAELGDRLGPINWQLAATKRFDAAEIEKFFALLPTEVGGVKLRHAMEVRHPSFDDDAFFALAKARNIAIVHADDAKYPKIDQPTADFSYARLMRTAEEIETGYAATDLDDFAAQANAWSKRGDAFVYFISGAKVRAPAAAQALMARL